MTRRRPLCAVLAAAALLAPLASGQEGGAVPDGLTPERVEAFVEGKGLYPSVITDYGAIAGLQVVLMAAIEQKRAEAEGEGNLYPGGAFDPLGFAKKSDAELQTLKVKEIANGRVAMLAFLGIQAQYQATGKGALECLGSHIAAPFTVNAVTNGVSVPQMPVSFL